MFSIILNTMLANHTSMRHFSHGFIKIKTISNNKHIGNNETTVVTLVTTTKRSVLLTQNASLVIIKNIKNKYHNRFDTTTLKHRNQSFHGVTSINNILNNNNITTLKRFKVNTFNTNYKIINYD